MCYYDRQALRESVDSVTSFAFGPGGDMGMPSPLREAPTSPDSPPRLGGAPKVKFTGLTQTLGQL